MELVEGESLRAQLRRGPLPQATGRPVDGRSDIFSPALVLLECWQGRHPFLRENVLDTLHAIAHDRLPALAYPAGSPEWGLARVFEKALEKDPDERYQTMKDLAIDLRRLRQERESGKMTPLAPVHATRRPHRIYHRRGPVGYLDRGGAWRKTEPRRSAVSLPARGRVRDGSPTASPSRSPPARPKKRVSRSFRMAAGPPRRPEGMMPVAQSCYNGACGKSSSRRRQSGN